MPSKRLLMRQARDRARTEVTRLDDERLAVKRIAARECGMVLYTQEIERGQHAPPERVHILSLPHEVPWADTPTPEGDAEWFRLPEREMRRIKRQVSAEKPVADKTALGVRIRTRGDGRMVVEDL